jgi:superfamily II DNA or RNA helicase
MSTNIHSYLGPKGYTIFKKEISIEKQVQIRNDLMIKPYTPGNMGNNNIVAYPAYRESDNKIYVPHYYGVEQFGLPKSIKISEGQDIHLVFNGKLREHQEPVVKTYLDHVNKAKYGGGLLDLPCAAGKTALSLYIISQLSKKTIVIVHKEFLMNQWIERIEQFLPEARVGKIQGQIIDIDNKDIVLVMLQSLSMKEYPSDLFNSFGLTIIDEVHHISSQTFSNALFKLVTKYMLGLSATMDRKDGTTKVFKMFLGDVIYKGERKQESGVEVRAITYKVNDPEFNDTILDYKGNVQNSSMISKLCEYNRRTEFIIKTLCDFISVNPLYSASLEKVEQNSLNPLYSARLEKVEQNPLYSASLEKSISSDQYKLEMDNNVPNCEKCNKNNNYLLLNTCCNTVKYCMPCLEEIEEKASTTVFTYSVKGKEKKVKERAKCPNCNKVLKYEQNYIENPYVKPLEQTHTIVMAHNLNVLRYIYKKFVCKNLASVGYYIGGMSEEELKKSEKKQVILASYSMCQEGLDIPTLCAEFLISPKTDIIQIVGRILRAKHAFTQPIIYDFVDSHDVFQRQWLKRKAYYKKQNYKIIGTDSYNYFPDITKWKIIYEPKFSGISCRKKPNKKQLSIKSNSTDKSIIDDSDSDNDDDSSDNDDDSDSNNDVRKTPFSGKCFLSLKKNNV